MPGDKSMSHRAVLFAALAAGVSDISGLLESEDVLGTVAAMRALGARAEQTGPGAWRIDGFGVGNFTEPKQALDFGNSGTGVRLVVGALATSPITVTLQGDASLSKRPMGRVLNPLQEMGLQILHTRDGKLPMTVTGAAYPVPISYRLPVPSAQVKSAILLAALNVPGDTTVIEAEATRDHTEKMLAAMGADLRITEAEDGRHITVTGPATLNAGDVSVPGDPSSAAFLAAAAVIVPGSDLLIEGVLANPTRTGFYTTLQEMGGDVTLDNVRTINGEEVADIRVRTSSLKGIAVPAARAPSMIDEYPVLAMLAAYAEGETRMDGIGELRVKESDRIAAMERGLDACGAQVDAGADYMTVTGTGELAGGAVIETEMDHRIAMSFLIAGLASAEPIQVRDADMIATSFPDFVTLLNGLGATITDVQGADA